MSRLLRPTPFDLQACECRPGYTLRWLCGVTEERALVYHSNGQKPGLSPRSMPADRAGTRKRENIETKAP